MGQPIDETLLGALSLSDTLKVGHQEIQRILEELEKVYLMTNNEWLAADPIQQFLCTMLGYEDVNELEDALRSSFVHFLSIIPTIQLRSVDGKVEFRMQTMPPQDQWCAKKMVFKVTEPRHLWNVVLKSAVCRAEIPEIGLEISPDGRQRLETLWNLLATTALDLSAHVSGPRSDSETDKIIGVMFNLGAMRDVEFPWTLILVDPSGYSRFIEMEEVEVTENYIDEGSSVDRD